MGIGANTALFSVVYSILLRPLPFRDPSRLAQIWETHPALPQLQVTAPDFEDWRNQTHSFEQIAAYTLSAMNTDTLLGQGEPAIVHATMASNNLFPLMGIRPIVGRTFSQSEEAAKQHVTLLSENLWRRKFAADPAIVGRKIRLAKESFEVIGIIPQRQAFPEWADLWIPLSLMEPELQNRRKYHPLEVVGRLKPGVGVEQAQVEIQTIARRLAQAHPETNSTIGAYVIPLAQEVTKNVRPSLLLAWAAVGLVLLIACANLAHLFLARIIERREELAIRRALGATASHLVRQLLWEGLLIAAIGGALGVVFAAWAGQVLRHVAAVELPRSQGMDFETPVWLFAIGISLIALVVFALPACWQLMRRQSRLSETGRSVTRGHSRLSAALLTGEVALALLVLSGTALLARNFAALLNEDPGFQAKHVWTVANLPIPDEGEKSAEFLTTRLTPALREMPGVVEVAAVNSAPIGLGPTEHTRFATRFGVEGRRFDSGSYPVAQLRWITPNYFQALGIALKRGRWLSEADRGKPRIIVNETMARRFFPNQEAVGKRLVLGVMDAKQDFEEIVGVTGDVRDLGLDQETEPTIYGVSTGPVMTLLVKTSSDSNQIAVAIRDAIHRVDGEIAVTDVQRLQEEVSDSLARRRFALTLLAIFAGLAAFLTAGGIYGLLTQSVKARVRELGVRAAFGAAPRELISMILREAVMLAIPGLIAGALLSLAFAGIMKSFLYKLSPLDPLSIGCAGAFLLILIFSSAWLPARRAAALDPALALRKE